MSAQDALQALESASQPSALDTLEQAAGPATVPQKAAPVPYYQSFRQGLEEPAIGLAQTFEHTPGFSQAIGAIRAGMKASGEAGASALSGVGLQKAGEAIHSFAQLFDPVTANQFDSIVTNHEHQYEAARQAAGQTGIDWWKLGGEAAPLALSGLAGGGETAASRIGLSAAQGAITGAAQPVVSPDSYWWNKAGDILGGTLTGGILSGLTEGVAPIVRGGVKLARWAMGANAGNSDAAAQIVSGALSAKGYDPASINPNIVRAYKQQVQRALNLGSKPEDFSPETLANLVQANSLPVPLRLTLGMASRNREQYMAEQRMMDTAGVGQPIAERMKELNDSAIKNLNLLGAGQATNPVTTGQQLNDVAQNYWNQLDAHKTALYDAVKNSKGLSAKLDGASTAKQAIQMLQDPQSLGAWEKLQNNDAGSGIIKTLENLRDDKLPLTVATWQALDQSLGQDAASAGGSVSHIINSVREMMANAPIADDAGQEARQAYQLAKQAHAQQMSIITPKLLNGRANPNFQPLMKAVVVDNAPPETLFTRNFLNAAPSVGKKTLDFMSQIDPNVKPLVSNTLMGEIKRSALNNASDENGVLSVKTLRDWANDPVAQAKMEAMMPDPAVKTFRALAHQWENVKSIPGGVNITNPSGTGQFAVNSALIAARQGVKFGAKVAAKLPGVKQVFSEPVIGTAQEMSQAAQLNRALNPPIALNRLLSPSGAALTAQRLVTGSAVPALIAGIHGRNKTSKSPQD